MKQTPIRTCVACRETSDKRELIRFVRTPEGRVELDPTGKKAGRGAYTCRTRECFQKALAGSLSKALKTTITMDDKERLSQEFAER